MLSGFCPARFAVLFNGAVLGYSYTPGSYSRVTHSAAVTHREVTAKLHTRLQLHRTGPCSQWSQFFLTMGVFECDISHRRSVFVLFMLHKIRCNPMHPLYGALPEPYVSFYWRAARSPFVSYCFPFVFFILWVGIEGLGSSD